MMYRSLLVTILFSCCVQVSFSQRANDPAQKTAITQIAARLDTLNATAARADFEAYFNCYSADGTFLGTDATEYWVKDSFMVWAKPYFDRKRAWNFTSVDRHIFVDPGGRIAWFDELLNTQMKICRGSGVLVKEGNDWKIKQYVLSMTVPNSQVDKIIPLKQPEEDALLNQIKARH